MSGLRALLWLSLPGLLLSGLRALLLLRLLRPLLLSGLRALLWLRLRPLLLSGLRVLLLRLTLLLLVLRVCGNNRSEKQKQGGTRNSNALHISYLR